jgi:hypothetical protein
MLFGTIIQIFATVNAIRIMLGYDLLQLIDLWYFRFIYYFYVYYVYNMVLFNILQQITNTIVYKINLSKIMHFIYTI